MANRPNLKQALGFAGDPRVPFAWAGWNDALAGRPMDYYLIDRAPNAACAIAYEVARYRVMALRDAGLPVPKWRSMKTLPPAILSAVQLANSFNAMDRGENRGYWPVGPNHWMAAA